MAENKIKRVRSTVYNTPRTTQALALVLQNTIIIFKKTLILAWTFLRATWYVPATLTGTVPGTILVLGALPPNTIFDQIIFYYQVPGTRYQVW